MTMREMDSDDENNSINYMDLLDLRLLESNIDEDSIQFQIDW
jgi:hypothetical protein